jgi:hypothetical protein
VCCQGTSMGAVTRPCGPAPMVDCAVDPRLDHPAVPPPGAGRPVDLAGAGLIHPAAPGPPGRRRPAAAVGAAPNPAATVALSGAARVLAPAVRARLAGWGAETLGMPARPAQGPLLGTRSGYPAIKKPTTKPRKKAAKSTRPPERFGLPFTRRPRSTATSASPPR